MTRIAVNGRFLTMAQTGVQRYAREVLDRLPALLGDRLVVIVPPDRILPGDDPATGQVDATIRWHGVRGHTWEQVTLPRLLRRARADILWSPCDWGPLVVRRQVPVIHDIAPLTDPEFFTRGYRLLARGLTGPLLRRCRIAVTPSRRVEAEIIARFGTDPSRLEVVPPGVGPPFNRWPLDDLDAPDERAARYCVLVGAHDVRKNASFLLDLWPAVHERTGLQLHLTRRSVVTTRHETRDARGPGVVTHIDPTDDDLAALYAGALCLLWPSRYEGYGFPLLEAMAVGTPFLSTDVGAATELAVDPAEQVLPLDAEQWIERLVAWHASGVGHLRGPGIARARSQTWEHAAAVTVAVLEREGRRYPRTPWP